MKKRIWAISIVVALVGVQVAPAAAQGDPPIDVGEIQLSQSIDVQHRQSIHVTARPSATGPAVGVALCQSNTNFSHTLYTATKCTPATIVEPDANGFIDWDLTVRGRYQPVVGSNTWDCWVTECVVAVLVVADLSVAPPILEALIAPISFAPVFQVSYTTNIADGAALEIVMHDAFPAIADSGIFSMQCAFRTTPGGGFACGPVGTAHEYVGQDYVGTLTVQRTFLASDGASVTCDVEAICLVALVVVQGSNFALQHVDAEIVSFGPE